MESFLVLDGITKKFGSFKANDRVNLTVDRGCVHCVMGENGAGKSTLMNVLYGLYQPDEGHISLDGRRVHIASPRQAMDLGIGMVHQQFMLVGPLTVTENIVLGYKNMGLTLSLKEHARKIKEMSQSFGFEIDPHQPIWKLPVGMQQRVEILKLLYRQTDILILDEPTSVLTPQEIGPFFDVLRRFKDEGKTVILITHKLDEVMDIADEITVMRAARSVASLPISKADPQSLAQLMVGRDVDLDFRSRDELSDEVVFEMTGVSARDDRGLPALNDVSFKVRSGEVFGIAGIDGNGQAELAEVIAGLREVTKGSIRVKGMEISDMSVHDRKRLAQIGYVPADRQQCLVNDHSIAQNMALCSHRNEPFARYKLLKFKAMEEHAGRLAEDYNISLRSIGQSAVELSGGNQQKMVIARELEGKLNVFLAHQPTQGLDVGATEFVQKTIIAQKHKGSAIIYISTELEHLLAIADTVAVIYSGQIACLLSGSEANREKVGAYMVGAQQQGSRC